MYMYTHVGDFVVGVLSRCSGWVVWRLGRWVVSSCAVGVLSRRYSWVVSVVAGSIRLLPAVGR